jgi:hypothetical protein
VTVYVKVVKASRGRYGATHAATETGELACGTKPPKDAPVTETSIVLQETTCRSCRAQLGLDGEADESRRLEALFVLSLMLGLRPGELRKLTWDHVDLDKGIIHVWRSASRTGDVSSNGVPIQEISDTVGHRSTHVTETVYRHVIVPAIRGGATVMDSVFGDPDHDLDNGSGHGTNAETA